MDNTYTITQVAEELKVHDQTIRKWEEDFDIKIPRNSMGHRYYTEEHLQLLRAIKRLKDEGANIHVINKFLGRNNTFQELQEQSMDLITLDKTTVKEFKELIVKQYAELIIHTMQELKEDFQIQTSTIIEEQLKEQSKIYEQKLEELQKQSEKQIEILKQQKDMYAQMLKESQDQSEKQIEKIREQIECENQKLMAYLAETREADKKKSSLLKRIFGRD